MSCEVNENNLIDIARRYGLDSLFEQLNRRNSNSKWSNTNVFFDNKSTISDCDSDQQTFCYLCSINGHEHERTKPRDKSQRRKLTPYKNPRARLSSAPLKQSNILNLISYRVIIRTGTEKNSGTRAQVFLYIYGTENNWTSINLQKSSNSIDGFPSGSTRTFCIKGPDIGQLHHLNVNLVGSRSDKEWFLKEIEITNLTTSITWLCEFNCWLPKAVDQEIQSTISQSQNFALTIYILQVRTGERAFAGTDANIQIIVRGSKNQTRQLALTSNRVNLFEHNQLDTFAIIGNDLGDLLELIIKSDRSQFASDWDLKEIIMWKIQPNDDQEKVQVYFPFNTWLGKQISTLKSKAELYSATDQHWKGPICYQIIVKTGRVMNAGTDANVYLMIFGKSARTGIHQLNNRLKNDFERNSISEFIIMDIDVGKIDRIKIWHDNTGTGSAWFLDSITIRKKYSTCSTISNIYIQRLEQISQIFYRQNSDDHESKDSLGNSRSILRSPIMSDRINLQKKVTWDEQSIGSQEDFLSNVSSKKKHSIGTTGHFEHRTYWISSHSFTHENQWQIKSIEEANSFDLDQSTRALLLSDRSTIKSSNDEIYDFHANRWLAKDKEDGKTEVFLSAKLNHQSTNSLKSKQDLKSNEQSSYLLNNSKMSTRSNATLIQHDESFNTQLKQPSRDIRHRLDSMNNKQKLLSQIIDETLPNEHPRKLLQQKKDSLSQLSTRITPKSLSLSQRMGSSKIFSNTSNHERDLLNKLPLQTIQPRQEQSRNSLTSNSLAKSSPRLVTNLIEPSIKSKSFVRSNPLLSTNKSISDRRYKSAYDIQLMDDF